MPALYELGASLGAYFMRWDAVNFDGLSRETYVPSEKEYCNKHAAEICHLMREERALHAKDMTRARYSPE